MDWLHAYWTMALGGCHEMVVGLHRAGLLNRGWSTRALRLSQHEVRWAPYTHSYGLFCSLKSFTEICKQLTFTQQVVA